MTLRPGATAGKTDTTQIFNPAASPLTKAQFVVKKEAVAGKEKA
jgi:hypothetical protein